MKLWILRLRQDLHRYDCVAACVIRAYSEEAARALASAEALDEGEDVWTDPSGSTCEELRGCGPSGVIVADTKVG